LNKSPNAFSATVAAIFDSPVASSALEPLSEFAALDLQVKLQRPPGISLEILDLTLAQGKGILDRQQSIVHRHRILHRMQLEHGHENAAATVDPKCARSL
jgi:hypothetical protein